MRCCALPTTCNVDSPAAQRVGMTLEALFLAMTLKPLATGFDALGDYGVGALAQSIAQRDSHGFGALIAARLEGHE
jgi:hypothetical protein